MTVTLVLLALKTLVLAMPLGVGFLAARRLFLSRTQNVWLYAATAILMIATAVSLSPWVFAQGSANPFAVGLALVAPSAWVALVIFCGPGKVNSYQFISARHAGPGPAIAEVPPLSLGIDDRLPDGALSFRHRPLAVQIDAVAEASIPRRSMLEAARAMRANRSSDSRRPKALPAPTPAADDLPFLRS